MSEEIKNKKSGWTVDTLKESITKDIKHIHELLDERDERYKERWQAQEAATKYSQEKSNEFRGTLDDLSTKQATKIELTTAVKTLNDKIETLDKTTREAIEAQNKAISELRSRLDVGNPEVRTLQNQAAISAGVDKGSTVTMGKIYALIAAIAALVGIISFIISKL